MGLPTFLTTMAGTYRGDSFLHLPWLEGQTIFQSESALSVRIGERNSYAVLDYTWSEEGVAQSGSMILHSSEARECTMGWSDSWHQGAIMPLKGESSDQALRVEGTYSAGDGTPDWFWEISLKPGESGSLHLEMTNISPERVAEWAVRAEYQKI
jgi:hypothetical protein